MKNINKNKIICMSSRKKNKYIILLGLFIFFIRPLVYNEIDNHIDSNKPYLKLG